MREFPYKLILASNSPRRRELLAGLDYAFDVRVLPNIDENYPSNLPVREVAAYLSQVKAKAYVDSMAADELIITADTVVICGNKIFGKPKDEQEAAEMLMMLSGKTHEVITGVSLTTVKRQFTFDVSTEVSFKSLRSDEINYYVSRYQPLDKAGAYGVQEWIGYIGVTRLEGSYFNVMGLPVQRLYDALQVFAG